MSSLDDTQFCPHCENFAEEVWDLEMRLDSAKANAKQLYEKWLRDNNEYKSRAERAEKELADLKANSIGAAYHENELIKAEKQADELAEALKIIASGKREVEEDGTFKQSWQIANEALAKHAAQRQRE